jgi:hypothetical protein
VTEPNRISELIIKRCSGWRLRFEQQGLLSLEQKKSAAHMTAALLSSPSSTALRDALGALVELQDSGAAIWLSEYEDLVPVADGELDNVGPYTASLPSRWEHVAVIVFCGAGSTPEEVVDLSHTVGVGPSPD